MGSGTFPAGQEQTLVARGFALRQQFLGVVRLADLSPAIIGACVGGNEFFLVKE